MVDIAGGNVELVKEGAGSGRSLEENGGARGRRRVGHAEDRKPVADADRQHFHKVFKHSFYN